MDDSDKNTEAIISMKYGPECPLIIGEQYRIWKVTKIEEVPLLWQRKLWVIYGVKL